jgi:hypothetical protein
MDKYYRESSLRHRKCDKCRGKLHQRTNANGIVEWEKCYCESKVFFMMNGLPVEVESWSSTVHRGNMVEVICAPVEFNRIVTTPMLFGTLVELKAVIDKYSDTSECKTE